MRQMEPVVIWSDKVTGGIIKYPPQLTIELVDRPYGHQYQHHKLTTERKKSKSRKLNKGELIQKEHFEQLRDTLLLSYKALVDIGFALKYFPVNQESSSSPIKTRSIDWSSMCDIDKLVQTNDDHDIEILEISDKNLGKSVDVFGKVIINITSHDVCIITCGCDIVIPSHSTFLMSDLCKINLLSKFAALQSTTYNLIVIDPPWENRSAIRGRKYNWLNKEDIFNLPVNQLLSPGGLVAIWVTNKRQLVQWTIDHLLPHWDLQYIGEWTWIKVTTEGKFVFDIDSVHKKPYENIIICKSQKTHQSKDIIIKPNKVDEDINPPPLKITKQDFLNSDQIVTTDSIQIPTHYHFLCVPSATHSQKPYIGDLLSPYIEGELKGLELFARNLLPNWTSWGNEVLKFQEVQKQK